MTAHRKPARFAVASLVTMALIVAACGGDDDSSSEPASEPATDEPATDEPATDEPATDEPATDEPATDEPAADEPATDEPMQGGRIVYLVGGEVPGFDPIIAVGSAGGGPMQREYAIFDALMYTESASGEAVPGIASSLTSADGGTTWTLKLREGVSFTDGTPFDADAVVYNWDRHAVEENGSPWLATVTSMQYEAVDPLTVSISLPSPNAFFPSVVARQLSYIGSPTAIEELGPDFNLKPVGAGPFTVKEWIPDSTLTLERNPDYWNAPRPYIDELVFSVIIDDQQRFNAWQTDQGQIAFVADPATVGKFRDAGANIVTTEQFGGVGVQFNLALEKWQDVRIREAIALAIDRHRYVEVTSQGFATAPDTPFTLASPFTDPSITLPEFDLAKAQSLVDEYLADSGQAEFEFTYNSVNSPAGTISAELLQSMVNELDGVTMDLNMVTVEELVGAMVAKNFDTTALSYRGVGPEPEFNSMFLTGAGRNLGTYSNPIVDEGILTAQTSIDPAVQREAYSRALEQLMIDLPFILLNRDSTNLAFKDTVHDVAAFEDGGLLVDRVWLSQ